VLPDVFITGDAVSAEWLAAEGFSAAVTARVIAGDRLALLSTAGLGFEAGTLFGITTQRFKSIAVGTEGTCAGYYARQALISDGAMDRVAERMVVVERSVETVAEPAAGAVQLGLSFASLVSQATGVKLLLVVDGGLHERIQYTAVAAADSVQDEAVQTFLDLAALDAELQQLLTGYGLTSRKEALRVVPAG
jgi:molybdate transport system substrate-binding protein